jgi:hypothetical protein
LTTGVLIRVILKRISKQANAHLPPDWYIEVSLHVLGSRSYGKRPMGGESNAMEISSHRNDRYI